MAQLNDDDLELLKNFKSKILDLLEEMPEFHRSDPMLSTWVRACGGDVMKAEEKIRKSLKYRREADFYKLYKWQPPADMLREYPYEISGHSKEGCPIAWIKFGKWDVKYLVEIGHRDLLVKYTLRILAQLVQECIEHSQLPMNVISQFVVLIDLDGFSMKQCTFLAKCYDALQEIVTILEAQFPEMLQAAVVINAPKIFPMFFNLLKRKISKRTLAKVHTHGTNVDKWKTALLRKFPADQISREYGGCRPEVKMDKISCANTNSNSSEFELGDLLLTIAIPPGQDFQLYFHVNCVDSQIRWVFTTDNYDIGFSILYENEEEVYPYEKCNSHFMQQEGSTCCTKIGSYFLVFDNKYSRVRGKILHYNAYVTKNPSFLRTKLN